MKFQIILSILFIFDIIIIILRVRQSRRMRIENINKLLVSSVIETKNENRERFLEAKQELDENFDEILRMNRDKSYGYYSQKYIEMLNSQKKKYNIPNEFEYEHSPFEQLRQDETIHDKEFEDEYKHARYRLAKRELLSMYAKKRRNSNLVEWTNDFQKDLKFLWKCFGIRNPEEERIFLNMNNIDIEKLLSNYRFGSTREAANV